MMSARLSALYVSLVTGAMFILILSLLLQEGFMAEFLLDRTSERFPYPLTIQNVMWLVFFFGMGELWVRYSEANREYGLSKSKLLPEDEETILRARDDELTQCYNRVRNSPQAEGSNIQRLIMRCITQFKTSRSVAQTHSLLNASLELMQHEIDLRYSMLRYIVWLIPTLGFIGTVVGIAFGLNEASEFVETEGAQSPDLLPQVTATLGVAFYTTMLALMLSAILVFLMHVVQGREELSLNRSGQYCLDNLINRLYEEKRGG
jgi:biopolymer transport protein ExbB/TolQ